MGTLLAGLARDGRAEVTEIDVRSFARLCHAAIGRGFDDGDFQLLQRFVSGTGQGDFALYLRQLKKVEDSRRRTLQDMYCENQMSSKLWLVEMLAAIFPEPPPKARLLGGWAGFQALLLKWLWSPELRITSVDLDAVASDCARLLSEPFGEDGSLVFETRDLFEHLGENPPAADELVICTIAEHLPEPADLIARLQKGSWLAVQGSSDEGPFDHVHAFSSMEAFRSKFPMSEVFFEGRLPWERSTRWMRIGQI